MSRRPTNFPPGIWQARRENDRQRHNRNESNRMNPTPSDPHSFQNSYIEVDPVPWRPAGETMIARIVDIDSPPEEPPAIVRIITHSRPRLVEAGPRSAELYSPTPRSEGNSTLTSEEQNMALSKLKKKVYDPPSNTSRRISFYYRENSRGNYNESNNGNSDEEGKRCAVCLEDFQPKEEVMTTPCNHMFHEACIVPWVKSNGQCPVCRFTLFERTARRGASSNNTVSTAPPSNLVDDDLMHLMRAMEEALMLRHLAGFW